VEKFLVGYNKSYYIFAIINLKLKKMPIKIKRDVSKGAEGKTKSLNVSIENKKGDKGVYFNKLKNKYSDGASDKQVNAGVVGQKKQVRYEMDKSESKVDRKKYKDSEYTLSSNDNKKILATRYTTKQKGEREFGNGVSSTKFKATGDKSGNLVKKKLKTTIRTSEPSKTSNTQVKKTKVNRFGSKVTTTRKGAVPVKQMKKK
jgi:hypothetical protein